MYTYKYMCNHTIQGKEFRRKFRTPPAVFDKIVELCKAIGSNTFDYNPTDACGNPSIPLKLKVLTVLRTLACGSKFDEAADLSGYMSYSAISAFFKSFVREFSEKYKNVYIRPLTGDEMLKSMEAYSRLGLPGCVGSLDGTFIPWDRIPKHLHNLCKGDKGKGLLYQVIVTHFKWVIDVDGSYYGSLPDSLTVKYNTFIEDLKDKKIYKDLTYKIKTGLGVDDYIELSSCYVIVDGGYIEWVETICGYPGAECNRTKFKFSDWIGSVRKDVECFFGILKNRFRFLKNPITLQNQDDVDYVFVTCCIINNMILAHDGLDKLWEEDVNWSTLNPHNNNGDSNDNEDTVEDYNYTPILHDDENFKPVYVDSLIEGLDVSIQRKLEFKTLRDLLANHLQIMYQQGLLRWPKTRQYIEDKHNKDVREQFPNAGDL